MILLCPSHSSVTLNHAQTQWEPLLGPSPEHYITKQRIFHLLQDTAAKELLPEATVMAVALLLQEMIQHKHPNVSLSCQMGTKPGYMEIQGYS